MARRGRPTPVLPVEPEPIEVLIVNDSAVVRQRLKSIIESDHRFRVVLAADPYEAVERLKISVPGVIVLDVEMPRMDGLTFLKKLMRQHPMPVVLCTTQAERAVTALEMGAIEVIAKPNWNDAGRLAEWSQNLLESIRNAARAGRLPMREDRAASGADRRYTADAVLPPHAYARQHGRQRADHRRRHQHRRGPGPAPVAAGLRRHRPGHRDRAAHAARIHPRLRPAARQGPEIKLEVAEARHHEPVRSGRALVIPGDKHGLIRRAGAGYPGRAGGWPAGLPAPAQRRGPLPLGGAGGRPLRGRRDHDRAWATTAPAACWRCARPAP